MGSQFGKVLKFGGSSVGQAERLQRVVEIVGRERQAAPVAVVVSAMGDSTDLLVQAAGLAAAQDLARAEHIIDTIADRSTVAALTVAERLAESAPGRPAPEITPVVRAHFASLRQILYGVSLLRERTAQTLDLIMAFGERLSALLVADLLAFSGIPARFVDSRDWLVTDDHFGTASVDLTATRTRVDSLATDWSQLVPVTMGFVGASADGRTTTLGRNGSDYTASLLAWALGASEVNVFTDVPGVMTADPDLVRDAYPLSQMSYLEALELANFGAAMFHPRTMIPLIQAEIPMRIRSTLRPADPGTVIDSQGVRDESRPTSVTSLENLALLGIQWRSITRPAQVAQRVLHALAESGVTIWMENQAAHGQAMALAVPAAQAARAAAAVEGALEPELRRGEVEPVTVRAPVTLLTLVGEAMGQTAGVSGRFFNALGTVGINVLASVQGASSRSVSCAIPAQDTTVAVRAVHAAFNFAHQQVTLLVLGKGTVGSKLLEQIRSQRESLRNDHDVLAVVAGLVSSRTALFDPDGIDLDRYADSMERALPSPPQFLSLLDRLCHLPVPVLVDCTAADGMEALYLEALRRGIHVVAANKKPLTIRWAEREALMSAARKAHRTYRYETTVGAGLPVIETLKDLVRTGDVVKLVEGSFSGTLGYLTNELMAGLPLSQAVRTARSLGYTEPNPQDDLSGLDVARKALILARELGFPVELSDVGVESLVPASMLASMPLEQFYAALEAHDTEVERRLARLRDEGKVLRYLARIDPGSGNAPCSVTVGPVEIPLSHPATRLRGSESFVAFTTERYADYPLIVQGAGAGGAVTAAGVLADVLRIAQALRGR